MNNSFYARFGLPILAAALFLLPIALIGSKQASDSNRNDVKQWLPASFRETADYQWFQRHFENETFILVSWDGCTLDDPRLDLLARKLVPGEGEISERDPNGLLSSVITGPGILEQMTTPPLSLDRESAISRLEGLMIGPDRSQTCAVFALSAAGQADFRSTVRLVERVAVEDCAIPRTALHMGGPPVDNVAIDVEGEKTLQRLAALSGLVGLGISWWCLRHLGLTLLVFACAVYSAALSMALVWYTGGRMNAILYSMPSVVYTAGLSGAIHIVNYYRKSAASDGVAGAASQAIRDAWLPCVLAASTTAVGLGSLYISDLIPIRQFGFYSALGVIATLPLLLFVLPAALQTFFSRSTSPMPESTGSGEQAHPHAWLHRVGQFIVRRNLAIFATGLLVMLACGAGLPWIKTSVNLMGLFTPEADIRQQYAWLEEHLGALVPMEVVVRIDDRRCGLNALERLELIEQIHASVDGIDEVENVMSALTFAPPLPQATRPRSSGMFRAAEKILLRNPQQLRRDVWAKRLARHRDDFLQNGYLSVDDQEELWRVSARLGALREIDYGQFVSEIESRVEPILQSARQRGVDGISVTYTGLTPLVYKAQRTLLNGLANSFLLAFAIIAAVMAVVFRSPTAGLLTMIPNVWPIAVVFGLLGWVGWVVDIGTMMTATVAMGVCVDDTVHFATWFRRGLSRGLDRRAATSFAYEHCAGAMYQSSLIVAFGLAVFALSSFMPTQRFGYLMVVLLAFGLLADLVLTPAMLASVIGRFFCRRIPLRDRETPPAPVAKATDREPAVRVHATHVRTSPSADAEQKLR